MMETAREDARTWRIGGKAIVNLWDWIGTFEVLKEADAEAYATRTQMFIYRE